MKNLFFYLILGCIIISCNNSSKQMDNNVENTSAEITEQKIDIKAIYEKNVTTFQKLFEAWEGQDVEGAINLMADNFMETGTGLGEPDRTKEEWKNNNEMMANIMKPTLKEAMFLPGVDTSTLEMDGSVRYYGIWNFASGDKNQDLKVYGSASFNEVGLMTSLTHYADFGMVMMQILPEEVVSQMMGGGAE